MLRKRTPGQYRVPGWRKAQNIPGWFGQGEARLLSSLCTGLWVEVGCYQGRSTTILAESGHAGYAIDTFDLFVDESARTKVGTMRYSASYEKFLRNMDEYENVIIVREDFHKVSDALIPPTVHLLHLDADHSYEGTKAAFEKFSPKVIPGGHVAFHDAHGDGWPGVEKFVSELDEHEWKHVESAEMLAAYRRL